MTFSDHPVSRHSDIWNGYMRAAKTLVEAWEAEPFDLRNARMIYPILFCYRHGLEMAMKWIISQYGHLVGTSEAKMDHNLWQLWQSCRPILAATNERTESVVETEEVVEELIKYFHELDGSSMAFRYSRHKNGATMYLPDSAVDIANLRDVMEGVTNFFGGCDSYLDSLEGFDDH